MRDDVEKYEVFGGFLHYTIRRRLKGGDRYEWFWTWTSDYTGNATIFFTMKGVEKAIKEDGMIREEKPKRVINGL